MNLNVSSSLLNDDCLFPRTKYRCIQVKLTVFEIIFSFWACHFGDVYYNHYPAPPPPHHQLYENDPRREKGKKNPKMNMKTNSIDLFLLLHNNKRNQQQKNNERIAKKKEIL